MLCQVLLIKHGLLIKILSFQAEYLDDDVFQDDDDDDYVPPVEKPKTKFKKPKLSDIKVFKGKALVRKVKVVKKLKDDYSVDSNRSRDENKTKSTTITCCKYIS